MQLGLIGFEVADLAGWTRFLTDVVGLVDVGGGRLRLDGHTWRYQLVEGPADDLAWVAWEAGDDDELDATVARLRAAGVDVVEADPGERDVRRRLRFLDPAGIPSELVVGAARAATPFTSPVVPRGFVADELGLGHLVLTTRDKAESVRFYTELLGARLSDRIVTEVYGHPVDLDFLHVNGRHHSVALGGPQRKRLHHVMVEVRDVDDVGRAHDRFLKAGLTIFQTIGRHPNDGMLSFYARSPSGFQVEVGWGGRVVDDATWVPETYDRISDWGHHPPQLVYARKP
jgi:2,3-dihydroxybiphenyl 1,2-dioxygenase